MGRPRKSKADYNNRKAINNRNYRKRKQAPPPLPPPPPSPPLAPESQLPSHPLSPGSLHDYRINAVASPLRASSSFSDLEHPFFNNDFFDITPTLNEPEISTEPFPSRILSLEPQLENLHIDQRSPTSPHESNCFSSNADNFAQKTEVGFYPTDRFPSSARPNDTQQRIRERDLRLEAWNTSLQNESNTEASALLNQIAEVSISESHVASAQTDPAVFKHVAIPYATSHSQVDLAHTFPTANPIASRSSSPVCAPSYRQNKSNKSKPRREVLTAEEATRITHQQLHRSWTPLCTCGMLSVYDEFEHC